MSLTDDSISQRLAGRSVPHRRESGFTLVEALVGLTILGVGLLGLAGLQMRGMRNNHEALLRSQAILQAYDIVDRMRANRTSAVNGDYNIGPDDPAPTSGLPGAVINDLTQWKATLINLPGPGKGSVAVANRVVTIIVTWNESRDGSAWMTFQTQSQL